MRLVDFALTIAALLATIPAQASEAVFRLHDRLPVIPVVLPPPPKPIAVTFEKKCSFDVIKLQPGTYRSDPLIGMIVYDLWPSTGNGQSNKWFFAHVADNCTAAAGSVGYRYGWMNSVDTKFTTAVAATGRATASVIDTRLTIVVSGSIWLSSDVGSGIALTKVD